MPDWDEDSPQLRKNLRQAMLEIAQAALQRESPTVEAARRWQILVMDGLAVPQLRFVGAFRGEVGLENVQVAVGMNYGVASTLVSQQLAAFEARLQALVAELDTLLPVGQDVDTDRQAAICDLCAWAHAEWVRIHPFANGNGRTARLWANSLAMRYGLPPFIRLRPRPDGAYKNAGTRAMHGDWQPTAIVFVQMLNDFLAAYRPAPSAK